MKTLYDTVAEFISGDWGAEAKCADSPQSAYCIRAADVVPIETHDYSAIPERFVSQNSFTQRQLRKGDIVIEKSGGSPTQSTGRVVYISQSLLSAKRNIICSNFCTAIRIKPQWDPYFVYQYWRQVYNTGVFFNYEGKTSGLKNLQLEVALKSIPVPEIDLPTQLRIAGVLGSIDEKIELNRKKIAELEALAKTIYDYWFVQFDFPDKNGKPYKSSGGKMVWNDQLKREVPEGWRVKRLEQVCDRIQSGGTPESKNEAYYGGSIPWFTTQELKDSWVSHSAKTITPEAVRNSAAKIFPSGTVLLAIYAAPTVGRLALLSVDATFNQACCGFVAGKDISKEYLFITLYEARAKLNSIADGTAQKNLSVGRMRTFDILVPEKSIMAQWRGVTEPIFDSIKIASTNIDDLTSCRDRILPLLMNGQVKVAG